MIKKLLLLLLLPLFAFATPFHTKGQIKEISTSVVKIYTASVNLTITAHGKKGTIALQVERES